MEACRITSEHLVTFPCLQHSTEPHICHRLAEGSLKAELCAPAWLSDTLSDFVCKGYTAEQERKCQCNNLCNGNKVCTAALPSIAG